MTRWRYKIATLTVGLTKYKWKDEALRALSVEEGLNIMGQDGWELVSSAPYVVTGTTGETVFVFKRPA